MESPENISDLIESQEPLDAEFTVEEHLDQFPVVIQPETCVIDEQLDAQSERLTISVSTDKKGLIECFRALRQAGYNHKSTPPSQRQPSWSAWFYLGGDLAKALTEDLRIYFIFHSTVCKMVPTGEMEHHSYSTPKYEVQCDSDDNSPIQEVSNETSQTEEPTAEAKDASVESTEDKIQPSLPEANQNHDLSLSLPQLPV